MFALLLALASLVSMTVAFPGYEALIPNGDRVPSPCPKGGLWPGVGHNKPQGTGDRNAFGEAFAAEGHTWTQTLCNADSDRDGQTNGQELGDPHCHWSVDHPNHLLAPSSHPGICEPVGSQQCSWQHFHCH